MREVGRTRNPDPTASLDSGLEPALEGRFAQNDYGKESDFARMNVDTMRRIDRLAGVPLCAVATGAAVVRGRCSGAGRPGRCGSVLFIELSEMGTTILADPPCARRPSSARNCSSSSSGKRGTLDLLGTLPPENVFTLREDILLAAAWDTLAFLLWTRRSGIDTVVDLELFSRVHRLAARSRRGVSRVGFHRFHDEGLYRGEMLTHRVAYNPHLHIAKNFIALVEACSRPSRSCPTARR